jgi:hypothetical protein
MAQQIVPRTTNSKMNSGETGQPVTAGTTMTPRPAMKNLSTWLSVPLSPIVVGGELGGLPPAASSDVQ